GFYGRRADDAVDPGGRTAADQQGQPAVLGSVAHSVSPVWCATRCLCPHGHVCRGPCLGLTSSSRAERLSWHIKSGQEPPQRSFCSRDVVARIERLARKHPGDRRSGLQPHTRHRDRSVAWRGAAKPESSAKRGGENPTFEGGSDEKRRCQC